MKFIDTNVLIHLITNDIPESVRRAEEMVADAANGEIMILDAVLAETCTILEFNPRFHIPRALICRGLDALLSRAAFQLSPAGSQTLQLYKSHPKLDIVDCLLATMAGMKSDKLLSFDKALLKTLG